MWSVHLLLLNLHLSLCNSWQRQRGQATAPSPALPPPTGIERRYGVHTHPKKGRKEGLSGGEDKEWRGRRRRRRPTSPFLRRPWPPSPLLLFPRGCRRPRRIVLPPWKGGEGGRRPSSPPSSFRTTDVAYQRAERERQFFCCTFRPTSFFSGCDKGS